MILGTAIFGASIWVIDRTGWPRCSIFALTAVLTLPLAIWYRPKDELLAE